MSKERPQGKKNTYLEDAFALANAWDSRRRHEPDSGESEKPKLEPREKRGSVEVRAALKKRVPEVRPRAKVPPEASSKDAPAAGVAQSAPKDAAHEKTRPRVRSSKKVTARSKAANLDSAATSEIPLVSPDKAETASAEKKPVEAPAEKTQREPEGNPQMAPEDETGATPDDATQNEGDAKRRSVNPTKRAVAKPKKADDGESKEGLKKESSAEPKKPKTKHPIRLKSVLKVIGIVVAILIVAAIGLASYAALNRWVLTDDATDIRGNWHMAGSTSSISISDTTIDLAGEATFKYVIDPGAKNIYETMSNVSGEARYRFSGDRQSLALFDEGASDWIDTARRDFEWFMSCMWAKVSGSSEPDLLGGESGVILYRQTETSVAAASASQSGVAGASDAVGDAAGSASSEEGAMDTADANVNAAGE